MQVSQSLSFQTQHELARLFECVIVGMGRLLKCFQYMRSLPYTEKSQFIFRMISKQADILTWQHLSEFLEFHKVQVERTEAIGLLLIMGGSVQGITESQMQVYLSSRDDSFMPYETSDNAQASKNEVEMTFVKILEEELLLERNADGLRQSIQSRWDYQQEAQFKVVARGKLDSLIDTTKFRQFFQRLRYPISEEELQLLMKRFGRDGWINYDGFLRVVLTLRQRVNNAIDEWGGISSNVQQIQKKKQSQPIQHHLQPQERPYFERLRRKYQQSTTSSQAKNKCRAISSHNKSQHSHSTQRIPEQQPKYLIAAKQSHSSQKIHDIQNSLKRQQEQISKSAIFHKSINLQEMETNQKEQQGSFKTPERRQTRHSEHQGSTQIKQSDPLSLYYAQSVSTEKPFQQSRIQRNQDTFGPIASSYRDHKYKQLSSLAFPFFNVIKCMLHAIEENDLMYRQAPQRALTQLSIIKPLHDWNIQWRILQVDTCGVRQKLTHQPQLTATSYPYPQQSYEIIEFLNKLEPQTIEFARLLFQMIANQQQQLQTVKFNFFSQKPCSYIQLYEELDMANKGWLDRHDILNLLRNAGITHIDEHHLDILVRQLNFWNDERQIVFSNFLKELNP